MTFKKLIKDTEKEIEKINLEHGTHTGINAEGCSVENCIDRDKINQLKKEILKIKQARQITLKEELEFLENCKARKILLRAGIHNAPAVLELNERIKKIKGELR